jgi:NifB/MoaA-like Fe-S oxidoreductase
VLAARGRFEGDFVVIPRTAHKSDEPVMLDGTRLDELERRLGLPVRALDLEGLARLVAG